MKIIKQDKNSLKNKAALTSIFSNTFLIILKLISGIISGSISIISEAIHSCTDLLASFIAFFAVRESAKPADEEHPFGHGKYEYIASFLESLLIILAGILIAKHAVSKLYLHTNTTINYDLGLIVMVISILVNFFVSRYMYRIAKLTNSPAILADSTHLDADIFSSIAVIFGLVMVKITHNTIFDFVIAVIVAILITLKGIAIFKTAQENLLDSALEKSQIEEIKKVIDKFPEVSVKTLKTRKSGIYKDIIIILLIDGNMTVTEAHCICDNIEALIDDKLKNTSISIHMEPIDECKNATI